MSAPRLILVNPRACSPRSVRLPLSLLALGAALEGRYEYDLVDGNLEPDAVARVLGHLDAAERPVLGVTVMPGPQMIAAIALSKEIRARRPEVPIVWGGYFPTLYPDAAAAAPYVDFVVRGQGEETLLELLDHLASGQSEDVEGIAGLSLPGLSLRRDGRVVHGPDRHFRAQTDYPLLPYHRLEEMDRYLRPTFMGRRTGVYQAAVGCRYRCEFCGVVSMWNGATRLGTAERLERELQMQRDTYGVDALQFYDHNFFDTEASSLPLIEVLAQARLPWWCYARADTLANFSARTWDLLRRSRLTMAYIGAEAGSDEVLRSMKKGTRVEHTFEVAHRCREHGVIPEFSFVLGGPEDPEGEIEKTFDFIKKLKAAHPDCEVILYFYTPTPRRRPADTAPATEHPEGLDLPATPEEWAELAWQNFGCHQYTPWLSERMHQRVRDFATVLGCRFPTVQDHRLPRWGRALLAGAASWRYASGIYARPVELRLLKRRLRLRSPQSESL